MWFCCTILSRNEVWRCQWKWVYSDSGALLQYYSHRFAPMMFQFDSFLEFFDMSILLVCRLNISKVADIFIDH